MAAGSCSFHSRLSSKLKQDRASAQALYGSITGAVSDPSGAVIPGASVLLTNTGTNQTREIPTNADGIFSFPNVATGVYKVSVTAPGFQTFAQTDGRLGPRDATGPEIGVLTLVHPHQRKVSRSSNPL